MGNLEIEDAETALLWNMISFIFGIISFALPKLAVAALFHRILNPTTFQQVIIWGLVSLVALIGLVNILIYVTMCDPIQGIWKPSMVMRGEAKCRDIWILVDYATFNGGELFFPRISIALVNHTYNPIAFSAFVDLCLAIFPGIVLFKLQNVIAQEDCTVSCLRLGVNVCTSDARLVYSRISNRIAYASAAATAMVKCAQIKGLADQADPTCLFPF